MASNVDVTKSKLQRIEDLYRQGILSQDDYQQRKIELELEIGKSEKYGRGIILIGAPGGGKSAHSGALATKYNLIYISPGNILRILESKNDAKSKEIFEARQSGGDPMNKINAEIVCTEIEKISEHQGFILDGFPVTEGAADHFEQRSPACLHAVKRVIVLNVAEEVAVQRLQGRWVHVPSGRIYHTLTSPPIVPGVDDITGEPLTQRMDDEESIVRKRIKFHNTQTPDVMRWFRNRNIKVDVIQANGKKQQVYETLEKHFTDVFQKS